jgi:putative nucleotidyltransferase with HDIG domain
MDALRLDRLTAPGIALLRAALSVAGRGVSPVLVGGAVRDLLLRRTAALDLDVAVPGGALALGRRLADRVGGHFHALDDQRGVARVLAGDVRMDIADYRVPALEGDLKARDFTVNALAVPLRPLLAQGRAAVIDPTGGLADLAARRLSLPAPTAIAEDPLRALRGVRLEASLGFRLTAAAARAIRAAAAGLRDVSPERVAEEMLALLELPRTAAALRRADGLGLLAVILPEVEPMRATTQPAPHRFPVLEHSLRAVAGADTVAAHPIALDPFGEDLAAHLAAPLAGGFLRRHTLKLAALLHDVSKPETRRTIAGRVRFFEHDILGAARARAFGERLRMPGAVVAVVERLVRHHLRPMHLGAAEEVTPRARYRFYRDLGPDTRDLLLLALVDGAAVRGQSPLRVWRHATLLRDLMAGFAVQQQVSAAPPLLRGEDVMARFDLGPGPEVGRRLALAREAQDLGLVRTREDALAFLDSREPEP